MCAALAEQRELSEQWRPALTLAELSEQRGESALAELPKQRRESALTLTELSEQRGKSALTELPKQRRESALTLAQGVL